MENRNNEIIKVLEYLRDNEESENVNRGKFFIGFKSNIEDEPLEEILQLLLDAKAIEIFSHIGKIKVFPEFDLDIYNYYKITEKGKKQLLRGTWKKPIKKPKPPKIPLTKEQKLERKKNRRDNMRHWWLIITIVVGAISLITWISDFFFNFNIWKFIKSMI